VTAPADPAHAILVCDRDAAFREALRNYLLAAGHARIEAVGTVRGALAMLRRGRYRCILIGLSRPATSAARLARVARARQPGARVLCLIDAADARGIHDASFVYVLKERAFPVLLDMLAHGGADDISSGSATILR
jgi:DNA-binding NarL/FixJ family response regulator